MVINKISFILLKNTYKLAVKIMQLWLSYNRWLTIIGRRR